MLSFASHGRAKTKYKGIKKEISAYKKRVRLILTAVTFIVIFSVVVSISYYLVDHFLLINSSIEDTEGNLGDDLPKAALIDALYGNFPNMEFTGSLNKTLREVGFGVDIYQGSEVTVDFLKELKDGYRLIVLRMHSAMAANDELYLFTAEPYSIGRYAQEQLFRLVKEAYPSEDSQSVFAVNWGFIKRCMTGKFNRTLIIAMGCDGICDPFMAAEFINQGSIGYVGWTGPVLLSHSDGAILYLIQALYVEKLGLGEAVEKTNIQIGEDPNWETILDCQVP